jgi:hypothetical protein
LPTSGSRARERVHVGGQCRRQVTARLPARVTLIGSTASRKEAPCAQRAPSFWRLSRGERTRRAFGQRGRLGSQFSAHGRMEPPQRRPLASGARARLLRCVENSGAQGGASSDRWFCRYSKLPEPTLNFTWNNNHGSFSGQDVTSAWICPAWFPGGICPNVVSVVEGTMTFVDPDTHQPPFSVLQDLVVVQSPAGERLYNYWVNRFVCPWFRSFAEAVAANPLTLPFDGTSHPRTASALPEVRLLGGGRRCRLPGRRSRAGVCG